MYQLTRFQLDHHIEEAANILRGQIGTSSYQDYLLMLLFLKCCSDQFDVWRRMREGLGTVPLPSTGSIAIVPREARWPFIQQRLLDRAPGPVIVAALQSLQRANRDLDGVFAHLDVERLSGRTAPASERLRDLVRLLSRYSLRDEDCELPDLLGATYEQLVSKFSDSGGRREGEFYTPGGVVTLLTRLLYPQERMSIYDPCLGSGGMLLGCYRFVNEQGGDAHTLQLCGQDCNGRAWAVAKMNMLLQGIGSSHIELADTLTHPILTADGELETFDRVISNPPFSLDYCFHDLPWKNRFRYGPTSDVGMKADLLFVQHMLAVTKPGGMAATVAPHGILFRGGSEQHIRRGLLDDDVVEAVIGLPPNLFYGTAIPTCVLVLRPRGTKPPARQGKVLFINADREYASGRVQNTLRAEDIEKITLVFSAFRSVPGYSRVVSRDELAANNDTLSVRRYVDNMPPPEPQDVRSHLYGGVPRQEVADQQALFDASGLTPLDVFIERDERTFDFSPAITERNAIRRYIENSPGVHAQEMRLREAFLKWWGRGQRVGVHQGARFERQALLTTFVHGLLPLGILDEYVLAGIIAGWWDSRLHDLRLLATRGPVWLIENWIAELAAVEDRRHLGSQGGVYAVELAWRLIPAYMQTIADEEARLHLLTRQEEDERHASTAPDEDEIADQDAGKPQPKENRAIQRGPSRQHLKSLRTELPRVLGQVSSLLTREQCEQVIADMMRGDLAAQLDHCMARQRQLVIAAVERWWDKYRVSLNDLEEQREKARVRMEHMLAQLGYYGEEARSGEPSTCEEDASG